MRFGRCAAILLVVAAATTACQSVSTLRYAGEQPMYVFMPERAPATGAPILIFNHGRPFRDPPDGPFSPTSSDGSGEWALANELVQAGIAVALPVRTGYFSTGGPDGERVPCNDPRRDDFERARKAAAADIRAAVEAVKSLPSIDRTRIFVGGVSAGGFASIVSIPALGDDVRGVLSVNGGRCGNRGPSIGGLVHQRELYKDIGAQSRVAVVFFSGTSDTVVPPHSSEQLYEGFCAGRGAACKESVHFVTAQGGQHGVTSMMRAAGQRMIRFLRDGVP
jgi:dienelactone hydrolase